MLKTKLHKILLSALTAMPALLSPMILSSCHDDPGFPSTSPEMTEVTGGYVTSFSLQSNHFSFPDDVDSVKIALISGNGVSECFGASASREEGAVRFHMSIPEGSVLPDGKYVLTMRRANGKSLPGRLSARFEKGMLSDVSIILPSYMLDGEGTEENPYLINDDDDFAMFLINLSDDKESYGAGLKFKQTADIIAPNQSSLIPGRGYWGAPFAGIYDGGGHTIRNLYYRGSRREDSDRGIGLFTLLTGSASIENLSMSGIAISGIHSEAGAIAGRSCGDVSLSNISLTGYLDDGDRIGGAIGYVSDGNLSVRDISLGITVNGLNETGGIAGRIANKASLTVDGVSTPDYHFSISGEKCVGGIMGISLGSATISNVHLEHKVSAEDSDISIIEAATGNVGGIVGEITSDAGPHELSGCRIICPVGGKEASNVGGMVGISTQASQMTLEECRMYSVVKGTNNVGGIIGKADFPGNSPGVRVTGADFSLRVAADDADAKIEGEDSAGGFAGWWRGNFKSDCKIKINLPINCSVSAGGAFGAILNSTIDTSCFMFGQSTTSGGGTTMRVSGSRNTGGFAGYMSESTIFGSQKFDYAENGRPIVVPPADRFEPLYNCVVIGSESCGGIVGAAVTSRIQHICSAASVSAADGVGGIAGYYKDNNGNALIEDCTFKGTIQCSEAKYVGGIVGHYVSISAGTVKDCVNYSSIKGGNCTGGIIGYLFKALDTKTNWSSQIVSVRWCVNKGNVNGLYKIGGIMGLHNSNMSDGINIAITSINNSMNAGKITGTGNSSSNDGIGGIVGFMKAYSEVANCANHGEVYASGRFHGVGGIAGSMGEDANYAGLLNTHRNLDLKGCCNTATINTDNADNYVGGILGYQEEGNKSDVNDCHNLGAVPCKQKHDSGGIVGIVDHLTNIYRCVNQGTVSHGNAIIGTHKSGSLFDHGSIYYLDGTGKGWPSATKVSKSNFTKMESFKGLDFSNTWEMTTSGPALKNCQWRNPELAK